MAVAATVVLGGTATPARGTSVAVGEPASAGAATPCVGLVVDARSIGSDVSTSCPKVAKHATGVAVLQAGGHSLGYRTDGLLCTIDGLPKSGCAGVSDTHYWAYFHRATGSTSWVYSSEGPATYEPAGGSTEGWVYDNGSSLKPENVPYPTLCGCRVTAASPSSSPKPTTPKPTRPRPTTATSTTPPPTTAPTEAASTAATPTASAASAPTRRHHHGTAASPGHPVAGQEAPSPDLVATRNPSPSSAALAGAATSSSGGHGLLDLLVVVLVVTVLGGLAVVKSRRRRTD